MARPAGHQAADIGAPSFLRATCGILVVMDQSDEPREETQQERAVRSLQAIFGGANLTAESMQLANEFTDRQTGRLKSWRQRWTGGKQ